MKTVLLLAVSLAACATSPVESAGSGARLDAAAAVGPLRVRPVRVVEDSRCPMNARCVWAGRLILNAEVRSAGGLSNVNFTLGEATRIDGGRLTLERAEPDRVAGDDLNPGAYRFTFRFERR